MWSPYPTHVTYSLNMCNQRFWLFVIEFIYIQAFNINSKWSSLPGLQQLVHLLINSVLAEYNAVLDIKLPPNLLMVNNASLKWYDNQIFLKATSIACIQLPLQMSSHISNVTISSNLPHEANSELWWVVGNVVHFYILDSHISKPLSKFSARTCLHEQVETVDCNQGCPPWL